LTSGCCHVAASRLPLQTFPPIDHSAATSRGSSKRASSPGKRLPLDEHTCSYRGRFALHAQGRGIMPATDRHCISPSVGSRKRLRGAWTRSEQPSRSHSLRYRLPVIDGLEFVKQLSALANTKSIPVVMITAEGGEAHVRQALSCGAGGYIRKPFSVQDMMRHVVPLLAGKV
jgi:Response regulator receiver domain